MPVARLFDDEPTMVSQLVRKACLDLAVQAAQHVLASGAVDEPALWAGHHHRGPAEPTLMQPGEPVQGVAFRHS